MVEISTESAIHSWQLCSEDYTKIHYYAEVKSMTCSWWKNKQVSKFYLKSTHIYI